MSRKDRLIVQLIDNRPASSQTVCVQSWRPQFVKYMGSKAKIIDFVVGGINHVYRGGGVCDLFAGTAILSAAIGRNLLLFSNDIQAYSAVFARAYLTVWKDPGFPTAIELAVQAGRLIKRHASSLPHGLEYDKIMSLSGFNSIEKKSRELLSNNFPHRWHLFLKNYSGTWWSAEQCLWIDAFREVAERYRGEPCYDLILASLMHAMAYNSQGTGHYAQYRDAKTDKSMRDILIYRLKNIREYFIRKYDDIAAYLPTHPSRFPHEITTVDFTERLATLPRCTVYADPPYCFVHYSRFYHAIETLVRYDYPELQVKGGKIVKGRYRDDRHQSPFCIRSMVPDTFKSLFSGVAASQSNLVLSYSNTGMIGIEELEALARDVFGKSYDISVLTQDHKHMTMGRRNDRHRNVEECLFLARRKGGSDRGGRRAIIK